MSPAHTVSVLRRCDASLVAMEDEDHRALRTHLAAGDALTHIIWCVPSCTEPPALTQAAR